MVMRQKCILVVFLIFCFSNVLYAGGKIKLKVFHAGSLSVPFAKLESIFENKYPQIDVRREASGSVQAVRKVTDLGKACDIIAVADYEIIPKMMFPYYTDYVKLFARNEIVLCYTEKSRYKEKINDKNWYKILSKSDVKWGFSNPNDDPCGYRTLMTIALASIYYKKTDLFTSLLKNFPIIYKSDQNNIFIELKKDLQTKKGIFIRSKSVELIGLLESGAIDYAFEYKSVAKQHKLFYIDLPKEINLGDFSYKDFYAKVRIKLKTGIIIKAKPIIYGITVLKNAVHPEEARLWEMFVTGNDGIKILKECFQIPIFPTKEIRYK